MADSDRPFCRARFSVRRPRAAEFDRRRHPAGPVPRLIDAVHSREGSLFLVCPPTTRVAATLQTHPPIGTAESDGEFVSPGALGVTWADLVELDYRDARLRTYMAESFCSGAGRGWTVSAATRGI
jgi:hypothetical protein